MAKHGISPRTHVVLGVSMVVSNLVLLIAVLLVTFIRIEDPSDRGELNTVHVVTDTLNEISQNDDKEERLVKLQRDLTSYYGSTKPACHLETDPAHTYTDPDGMGRLSWRHSSEGNFIEEGLELKEGSVEVKTDGFYFIYSQIVYEGNGTDDLEHGRIIHKVEKRKLSSKGTSPTTLLQNFRSTWSIRRGREVFSTSLVEGTFYLEKNSRISVLSSIPSHIDHSSLRTYYGMFLM